MDRPDYRFRATLGALKDCENHMGDTILSKAEGRAREDLKKLCLDIAREHFDLRDELEG